MNTIDALRCLQRTFDDGQDAFMAKVRGLVGTGEIDLG
jgi:hypothetical protein